MISPKARALIGIVTTIAFAVVGVSFLLSERFGAGTLLMLLASFRGVHAARQVAAAFGSEENAPVDPGDSADSPK